MIRKILSLFVLITCTAALQIGCGGNGDNGNGPEPVPPTRLVVENHQDPTLDGGIDSPVWDSIATQVVEVGNKPEYVAGSPNQTPSQVKMKALIADDSLLYIWAQWIDYTENNRFGQLHATYVGPGNLPDWGTDTTIYNEDRFYILFDNGSASGANCAAYCHGTANPSGRKFYGAPGDNVDIWQWKAHRTGLAKFGEDMYLTEAMISPDPMSGVPGDSLFYGNDGLFEPRKMHPDGPAYEGAGLLQGVWVDFDRDLEWVVDPPDGPPYGKDVPGYYFWNTLLENQADMGSRWDIRSVSSYDAGTDTWTLVFRRSMTTGNSEDVDFSAIADSVAITIGITNNSGVDHTGREPFYMVFP